MNTAELIEHLKTYASDREVVFMELYGEAPHLVHPGGIGERTIFVNRIIDLALCAEGEGEPVRSIEAVLIENHHDEERKTGINVGKFVEHLRTYPSDHEVMLASRFYEDEDDRYANLARVRRSWFKQRTVFEKETTDQNESPKLQLRKSHKTKRSIDTVILESYADDGETPGMKVEGLVEHLETYPLDCEMILKRGSLFRLNLSDFHQCTVFENERIYLSATASENTQRSIDAVCLGCY